MQKYAKKNAKNVFFCIFPIVQFVQTMQIFKVVKIVNHVKKMNYAHCALCILPTASETPHIFSNEPKIKSTSEQIELENGVQKRLRKQWKTSTTPNHGPVTPK